MPSRLKEVLKGAEDNYILPFFWQHGEEEDILREEIDRIHESGIRALCVESRPHPDFLGPRWWRDMDIILEEAQARGMRVWILDDDHFPTGHAAGRYKDAPRELRRLYLSENFVDAFGPQEHSTFLIGPLPYAPGYGNGGALIAAIAMKRDPNTGVLTEESMDVTDLVQDGKLHWDVPEGYWRIFSIIESEHGGDPEKADYMNPLVAESVRLLIDTVHESFYSRYRQHFGKTLAGFFSDEPGFYNDKDTWDFNSKPGKKGVSLPWSRQLYLLMEREFGSDYRKYLPLLWHDGGESTTRMRYAYMNLVSKLYGDHFTAQIGDWCRQRGVEYIGHVLEDNNVHARLGSGAGHFYRALGGQDMSGVDVVLWQLRPGFDRISTRGMFNEGDAEFYHYGMAKMAVSLAHLDPKKKGRTMAEVFGAYGWAEGLKLMKWLTDHMLVRGVNYFVPHAFSPKEYPDRDCPPHLYARGHNPQFRYYKHLNRYTNRLSHLLSGGTHVATAVVLYHAEAEWSGKYMPFQKPVRELMRSQIDCDIWPCDTLVNGPEMQGGKLVWQEEAFDCLIVPYSEALPAEVIIRLLQLAEKGLPLYFVEGLPHRSSQGDDIQAVVGRLAAQERVKVVSLNELAGALKVSGCFEVRVKDEEPFLRYYHMRHADMDVYMFFNEHPHREIHTEVFLPVSGDVLLYDAYANRVREPDSILDEGGISLKLVLSPTETIVAIAGSKLEELEAEQRVAPIQTTISVEGPWRVSTATAKQYPTFTAWREMEMLTDLSRAEFLPNFSGTIRYETELNLALPCGNRAILDLGRAFETAEVFVGDRTAGVRISAPYLFDLTDLLQAGSNTLAIEVTNTLVRETPDFFSRLGQLEPSGLLGPVTLNYVGIGSSL